MLPGHILPWQLPTTFAVKLPGSSTSFFYPARPTQPLHPQVKSLQAAVKAGQKEAAALPAGEGRAAALQRLHECRAVLHGLGPGGDL